MGSTGPHLASTAVGVQLLPCAGTARSPRDLELCLEHGTAGSTVHEGGTPAGDDQAKGMLSSKAGAAGGELRGHPW